MRKSRMNQISAYRSEGSSPSPPHDPSSVPLRGEGLRDALCTVLTQLIQSRGPPPCCPDVTAERASSGARVCGADESDA